MLKRIHVRGFKSLSDVEVELAPLVVLLGPNAAGKSNFLEALLLVSRLVTRKTLAEGFEPPLRGYPAEAFSLPEDGLPGLLARPRADLSIEIDLQLQERSTAGLRYRIGVEIEPKTGALGVCDEFLAGLNPEGSLESTGSPPIKRKGEQLIVTGNKSRPNRRYVPLGVNYAVASNPQFTIENRYPEVFDLLRGELARWHTYYLDPGVAMRKPQPPRDVSDIGVRGELLAPFLHRLKKSERFPRHFDAVRRALRSAIPSVEGLDVDLDMKRGELDIQITHEGTPYSSRVISEGTLRILALCAIAANPEPSSLIAFEEPETGVHPRRIEVIADLLTAMVQNGKTQVVVTTHSPTLVAAMLRRQREMPGLIRLLACNQEGRATRLTPFQPAGPLFDDDEIRSALSGAEDDALVQAVLVRGWLDG